MTVNRKGLALKREGDLPADLYLDEFGNLALVENTEAIGQHVRQRLMTYAGEWFLDVNAGVNWLSDILGNDYDPAIAEALTKTEILETDGVTDIESFSIRFDRNVRHVKSYGISVQTDYDEGVSI